MTVWFFRLEIGSHQAGGGFLWHNTIPSKGVGCKLFCTSLFGGAMYMYIQYKEEIGAKDLLVGDWVCPYRECWESILEHMRGRKLSAKHCRIFGEVAFLILIVPFLCKTDDCGASLAAGDTFQACSQGWPKLYIQGRVHDVFQFWGGSILHGDN